MGKIKDWMMEMEDKKQEWPRQMALPERPLGTWVALEKADYKALTEGPLGTAPPRGGLYPPSKESVRSSVLNEANKIVNGERANTYGGPEDSFKTIAGFWSTYLKTEAPLEPADVAAMLALLKIARLQTSPSHRDSWVDLAGYAACGAECGLKKEEGLPF